MPDFSEALAEIVDRRQADIGLAKRAVLLAKTKEQKKLLRGACVLLIYAALEGGVRELTGQLFGHINRKLEKVSDLSEPFLCLAIGGACSLENPVTNFIQQQKIVSKIRNAVNGTAQLPGSINTESNITPKVFAKICASIGVENFLTNEDEKDLNQLLRFRNNIAHGDQEMLMDSRRIDQFSRISQLILTRLAEDVHECYLNNNWLTKQ
ncbi:MAG: MAE_28990/MAE_18760 family HEPN-like nuclease [Candidatus Electrothrix sp. YB6]